MRDRRSTEKVADHEAWHAACAGWPKSFRSQFVALMSRCKGKAAIALISTAREEPSAFCSIHIGRPVEACVGRGTSYSGIIVAHARSTFCVGFPAVVVTVLTSRLFARNVIRDLNGEWNCFVDGAAVILEFDHDCKPPDGYRSAAIRKHMKVIEWS
ncbi:hypothetical protein IE81DRAFT_98287 [Ceraceosorus guamensis]|uniref:Uncharacterized protein n=1 Tax=Ceraceosorus guamensis TaxID=1522189 RepID=A0A316W0F0_9BASI|nr:hypothetical protein IE81DRAFT_98287 [Ceraceosorus guamensis]PWN43159.1 hypothetical protein IE81DRAFT_98287 [Ceraceosorus guamensis]